MADLRNRRMDDPEGLASRVFVGNIPLDTERDTLKEKFEVHGKVNGVMVLKGFAFIQFDNEAEAKIAIEKEKGTEVGGKKIDVKQAKQQKVQEQPQQLMNNQFNGGQWDEGSQNCTENTPMGGSENFRGSRGRGGMRGRGMQGNFGGPQGGGMRGNLGGPNRGNFGGPNRGNFGGPGNRGNFGGGGSVNRGNFGGHGNRGGFNNGPGNMNFGGQGGHDEQEYCENYQEGGKEEEYNEMSDMEKFNERLNADDMDIEQEDMGNGGNMGPMGGMHGRGNMGGTRGRGNFRGRGGGNEGFGGGIGWGDGTRQEQNTQGGVYGRGGWGGGNNMGGNEQEFNRGRGGWGHSGRGDTRSSNGQRGQPGNMGSSGPMAMGGMTSEKPTDVEIVCIAKSLRAYAENIENRLKNMGLSVDVLFPNPEIPIGKVLGNIASRGVMYAICVGPENEQHLSLTLNVLQGQQQEHRNMPVDDAMTFISKSFANMVNSGPSAANKTVLSAGHPGDILKILGFLSDNRPLSIMEYDKMIKYLVSKRQDTLKEEYGESIPAHLLHPPVGPHQEPAAKAKQEELQNRVQMILNRSKVTNQQSSSGLTPSLQAAIENLVKTGPNLLSSMAMSGPQTASAGSNSNLGGLLASLHGGSNQSQAFQGGLNQGYQSGSNQGFSSGQNQGFKPGSGPGSQGSFGPY